MKTQTLKEEFQEILVPKEIKGTISEIREQHALIDRTISHLLSAVEAYIEGAKPEAYTPNKPALYGWNKALDRYESNLREGLR